MSNTINDELYARLLKILGGDVDEFVKSTNEFVEWVDNDRDPKTVEQHEKALAILYDLMDDITNDYEKKIEQLIKRINKLHEKIDEIKPSKREDFE